MAQFNEYVADGTTRLFAYRFPAFEKADIQVSLDGIVQLSGWSPLGLGGGNGGAVEFTTAPAGGVTVRVARVNIAPQVAFLVRDENLADVQDKAAGRTNLGVYSTAQTDAAIDTAAGAVTASSLQKAANLSDVADVAQARANLGVPAAADTYTKTQTDDAIDAAAGAVTASSLQKAANLSDVADVAQARTNLGVAATIHSHSASDITSGVIASSRLGSGTASAATVLRGDQTWASISTGSWELVSTVAASGATSLDFTNLSSGYDYLLVIDGYYSNSPNYVPNVLYQTGGTIWQESDYSNSYLDCSGGTGAVASPYSATGVTYLEIMRHSDRLPTNANFAATLRVFIPNPAAMTFHKVYVNYAFTESLSNSVVVGMAAGQRNVSEAITGLRFRAHYSGTAPIYGTFILYRCNRS